MKSSAAKGGNHVAPGRGEMRQRYGVRSCLVIVTTLALLFGGAGGAAANTELTPAARLVAPFFDISEGRNTFLILTNVSRWVRLDGKTFPCRPVTNTDGGTCGPFGVHLEFYGQSCKRVDIDALLSPGDVDVLDLGSNPAIVGSSGPGGALGSVPLTATGTQSGVAGRGWVDIDVRSGAVVQPNSPGVQANVLMGTVIITDAVADTAIEYPMAPSIGISDHGLLGRIVQRNAAGRATDWTGRYEPFPRRVFVPSFLAEGVETSGEDHRMGFATFLALAAPADGNWDGSGNGEAPGQQIGAPGSPGEPLILTTAIDFDGCESSVSSPFSSHYVNNFLSKFLYSIAPRTLWTATNCTNQVYPGRDELSGQAVGWIDISNQARSCDNTTPGTGEGHCPSYNTSDSTSTTFTGPGNGTGQPRGLVGVLLQHKGEPETRRHCTGKLHPCVFTTVVPLATATRLWGDRTPWQGRQGGGKFPDFALCASDIQHDKECTYSFEGLVSDQDIAP